MYMVVTNIMKFKKCIISHLKIGIQLSSKDFCGYLMMSKILIEVHFLYFCTFVVFSCEIDSGYSNEHSSFVCWVDLQNVSILQDGKIPYYLLLIDKGSC